jgi:hypothetical protein
MRARTACACGLSSAALGVPIAVWAQTLDVERPLTLVVGEPARGARADRVDAARTGFARSSLPTSGLHTEWKTPVGAVIEHAPLVDARGATYVIGTRGEVISLGRDGAERWRVSTNAMQPGPGALLSDDTLVFVDAAGEAVAVREGVVRWRSRFGPPGVAKAGPLPLTDGGVVVATAAELEALDAEGRVRARATLPEGIAAPLVSALGKVVAITASGAVWTWAPGAPEATRVASFGFAIAGAAALADDHTLVAVRAGQALLVRVDLGRGTTSTWATSPGGVWLGPPAMRGETAYVIESATTGELAVSIDLSGRELGRVLLLARAAAIGSDGGPTPIAGGTHCPPVVDGAGTIAFATTDGSLGVVTATEHGGSAELLRGACGPAPAAFALTSPAVVGLAPLSAGAFVAVCHSGSVLAVTGQRDAAHL